MSQFSFFPPSGPKPTAEKVGFRGGLVGTHTSRTMMFAELAAIFAAIPGTALRPEYVNAVVEANCLGKPTTSTRRLTLQRLTELYALDPEVPIFRILRRLWSVDSDSRSVLALLAALARDPLLMATAPAVLSLPHGTEMIRQTMREAVRSTVGERLNDATLEKVIRNAASSWTQSGHLVGRTFKSRQKVHAGATAVAFAFYLGTAAGFQGEELLTSGWVKSLDCRPSEALDAALDAKRIGLLDLKVAGNVFDLNLQRLDPKSKGAAR
jgi:hypothetical protein